MYKIAVDIIYRQMDFNIIEQRLVNISSSTANLKNASFKSDVIFNFPNIFHVENDITHMTLGVLNAQIPVSFYTINYTNDTLVLSAISTAPITVSITRGNYNSNSLIEELKAKILTATGFTMDIVTNRVNGIMSFTNASTNFTFYGTSTIFSILGFVPNVNYNSSIFVLTAPFPLNLLGIKRLKINSGKLNVLTYDSTQLCVVSTIASIPVNCPSFGLIDYNNNTGTFPVSNAQHITAIDIQILDENDNYINFNNADWTITLQLNIYRQRGKQLSDTLTSTLNDIDSKIANFLESIDLSTTDTSQDNTPIADPETDTPIDNSIDNIQPIPESNNSLTQFEDISDLMPTMDEIDILQY